MAESQAATHLAANMKIGMQETVDIKEPSRSSACRPWLPARSSSPSASGLKVLDVDGDRGHLEILAVLLVLALLHELRVQARVSGVAHSPRM